ncbi:hypothetical protein [Pseudomonas cichorii]|uniref:hypothetical protein n=1 Tax=Pseudomonas cichorii TaxID=36746 RepID=UPI001C88F48E|nr:hypothetical protein [Pseudomonas cichorii]MBX8483928.1 hypothetical protein [Pseudomonas cichorii]MBX8497103.1 hypothetical protein [Pseudomonas cichorii]MBX8514992.1 hypothetical protein [Pseudomonas cichorii]MBX8530184.1 hypothetical protein [Pseudomonas cichorii]MBX8576369.1 hypothetical protein [Pseudomonas cichorii]
MYLRACIITLMTFIPLLSQAAPAPYYKWQGASRIVCAQTSPGPGWKRLNGSFIKSDCSI